MHEVYFTFLLTIGELYYFVFIIKKKTLLLFFLIYTIYLHNINRKPIVKIFRTDANALVSARLPSLTGKQLHISGKPVGANRAITVGTDTTYSSRSFSFLYYTMLSKFYKVVTRIN